MEALPAQLARLRSEDGGSKAVLNHIQATRKTRSTIKHVDDVPSKRLKGQGLIHEQQRLALLKADGKVAIYTYTLV